MENLWDRFPNEVVFLILGQTIRGEVFKDSEDSKESDDPNDQVFYVLCDVLQICKFVCKRWDEILYTHFPFFYMDDQESACISASSGGRLITLKWLYENGAPMTSSSCYYEAAKGGHTHIMEFLWEKDNRYWTYDDHVGRIAAAGGHIPVLSWLKTKGDVFYFEEFNEAAKNGHLETLQWLFVHGYYVKLENSDDLCKSASNHLHILRWLYENGKVDLYSDNNRIYFRGKTVLCTLVAGLGEIDSLRYLSFTRFSDWNEDTTKAAYENGHLKTLQYLIRMRCPCDEKIRNAL